MRTARSLHREDKGILHGNHHSPTSRDEGRWHRDEGILGVPVIQLMADLFGVQTTTSEPDREVLHINDVKVIQTQINTNPKVLHAAAEDEFLQGQTAIKWNSCRH